MDQKVTPHNEGKLVEILISLTKLHFSKPDPNKILLKWHCNHPVDFTSIRLCLGYFACRMTDRKLSWVVQQDFQLDGSGDPL